VRYLTLNEVLEIHGKIISLSGGTPGILNLNALESAVFQSRNALLPFSLCNPSSDLPELRGGEHC